MFPRMLWAIVLRRHCSLLLIILMGGFVWLLLFLGLLSQINSRFRRSAAVLTFLWRRFSCKHEAICCVHLGHEAFMRKESSLNDGCSLGVVGCCSGYSLARQVPQLSVINVAEGGKVEGRFMPVTGWRLRRHTGRGLLLRIPEPDSVRTFPGYFTGEEQKCWAQNDAEQMMIKKRCSLEGTTDYLTKLFFLAGRGRNHGRHRIPSL
ncbi:uncharacterized protein F5Z01DRAFT_86720 [Emericellopsis atlantica]|uniref:Uncharacterized protein n=1 Tax=Emericellopsis atlantica TaxID=2614577 RepID=A0A9P7ZMZ2_9HYPO|nr:uncharacterized protein F5Z01DRAFT_86720 [Emericellopsis atlantica]KAG9254677.1 hypothetical protein F5Z01DRAFT_86720 [Emericellopsis atlantica]